MTNSGGVVESQDVVLVHDPVAISCKPPHKHVLVESFTPLICSHLGIPDGMLCVYGAGEVGSILPTHPTCVFRCSLFPSMGRLLHRGGQGPHVFVGPWGGMNGVVPPEVIWEEVNQCLCSWRCCDGRMVVM